ncbi:MAG: hypothetical protein EX271_13635 [Acidimicrobiales bacterium]|nr:amidohydrolase family protein [Hyphomonadaceae bacterium]RZV34358.1 MAG: hypothetical protein EX271_13635 [Acidimicrobiales bacterium]
MKAQATSVLMIGLIACQPVLEADTVIENGLVFIGDNSPAQEWVVAIRDDEIIYVGIPTSVEATTRIDASGDYVVPGFIDPHTHSLSELLSGDENIRSNKNYLLQGVTTVFNGNDGYGDPDLETQFTELTKAGIGTNTALFIGHGALRKSIMGGDKRAPSVSEIQEMKNLVDKGMAAGAIGLSTGLFYAPGSFSDTDEIIDLAKTVAKHGGVYDSHIRDESSYNIGLEAAIEEVIEIARKADIPANIAHIKALGVDVWGKSDVLIKKIEHAQAEGLKITADQYPWQASGTRISNALLPRWVKAGSHDEYMNRLDDPELLDRIKNDTTENLRKRGGPEAVLITEDKYDWQNRNLGDLSRQYNMSPIDMAIDISRKGDARIASFNMNAGDIENFMKQDWVMTSSDGSTGHPRKYASYPKKYRDYVVGKNIMPVETFFYRSSGLVADTFNLCNRGYLHKGFKADIAVIDPDSFAPIADFQNPELLSEGVVHVFVNGQHAVSNEQPQVGLFGQVVKRCKTKEG